MARKKKTKGLDMDWPGPDGRPIIRDPFKLDLRELPAKPTMCTRIPVYIPQIIVEKMRTLVQSFDHEVGWICTANDTPQRIEIKELFVFKQRGHGASYDMLPEEFYPWQKRVTFGQEPNAKNGEVRCQGHSHVNMPCMESNRDVAMAERIFGGRENIYTISIIVNKKDDYEAYMYVHRPVEMKFKCELVLDTADTRHLNFNAEAWLESVRYKFEKITSETPKAKELCPMSAMAYVDPMEVY